MRYFISVSYTKERCINNQRFCILWLDEHADTISDSNKQVDPRSDPMAETHIVDRVWKLSVRAGLVEPAVIGVIGKDLVKNFLENLRVELSLNILSPLNTNMSKAFMIGAACKSVGVDENTLNCTPPDRTIRNHSRIGTQELRKVFSVQSAVIFPVSPNG